MKRVILLLVLVLIPVQIFAQSIFSSELKLTRSLKKGMSGSDVTMLQVHLSKIPGIYDSGATGYFGGATEKAVQKLQRREGLVSGGTPDTTGYGAVGPRTLKKINELVRPTPSPSSPTVTTASTQPSATSSTTTTTPAVPAPQTQKVAAIPSGDTTPPVRSQGFPSGVLPYTTRETRLSVVTNEPARCYWSNTPNTPFEYMATAFGSTGGTYHSSTIWSVYIGDYSFYVKCRDNYANTNTSDYPIIFSVENRVSGGDKYPPRIFMTSPSGGESLPEGFTTLSAAAADNAEVKTVNFFLNDTDLSAEDTQPPYSITVRLFPGQYTAFATAEDAAGNRATSSRVSFSVVAKPATTTALLQPHGAAFGVRTHAERNVASPLEAFLSVLKQFWTLFEPKL